ncbi:MAG: hypothetical protein M3Y56_08230 [Armatimonadota bacterium]|nr:hypothetical protein [Armatimonadota bacterium]
MYRIQKIYRQTFVLAALAAALAATQVPGAMAQNNSDIVLNQGTVIPVKLNDELTSNRMQQGDTFTATVDSTKDAYRQILDGATVEGVVDEATPQNGKNPGTLSLSFTRLRLASGSSYNLSGTPTSLDPKSVTTRSDGRLEAKNTSKDNRVKYAGYGAGAGLLVSVLSNGKLNLKNGVLDSVIGGVLGYVAGSVLNKPTQVHDVDLKRGTEMGVLLNNDVTYSSTPRTGGYTPQSNARQSYISNGTKHYWVNGREWVMNLETGQRHPVYNISNNMSNNNNNNNNNNDYPASNYKHYTYEGNSYVLNRRTGERTLLR